MKLFNMKKSIKTRYIVLAVLFLSVLIYLFFNSAAELTAQKGGWTAITHDKTNFPLVGKHRTVPCADCHLNGVMQGTPMDCEACHWDRKQDDRYRLQLGVQCGDCHTPFDWKIVNPAAWEHERVTGFRLEGVHKTMDCFQCHKNNMLTRQPGDCISCHEEEYREASEPNHTAAGFPTDCKVCHHSMVTWEGAVFDHSAFVLRGLHKTAGCSNCHGSGVYSNLPSDCVDCHRGDYDNTANPNHNAAGYPTDCASCHGIEALSWQGAAFDHSRFPLNGNHQTAACSSCHQNGQYIGTPSQCSGCHMDDYNATTNPNHQQSGYSTDCENCHGSGAVTWKGAVSNHSVFPLKGKHKTADCTDCHINGVYTGTPSQCVACHQDDYNGTTSPNHQQAGYSTDCESCHGSNAVTWKGAVSNHSVFPLKGKHQTAACTDCHINGVYLGTPSDCVDCHRDDYNATTDPNHQLAGFPTDCVPCHGSDAVTWENATFNHNQYWPLQGAHTTLGCSACHSSGYDLPRDCYGCHKADYDNTRNPNHVSAGFPTTCESCHFSNHVRWDQAVFNHQFPIDSGAHRNLACTDCHLTANYAQFSCIDCHEHNKSDMDKEHREVRGYSYSSQACYTCHPTGRGGD